MLDLIDAMRDNSWNEDLSGRQLDLLPYPPFMLVTRIRGLDRIGLCLDLQHQVDIVLQLQIMHPRRNIHAVAGMEAYPIFRNSLQGMIHHLDMQFDEFAALLQGQSRYAIVMCDQSRIVDLQQKSCADDCAIFFIHRVGERRQILFVRRIEFVRKIHFQIRRRDRGDKRLFDRRAVERMLQVLDVRLDLLVPDIFDRPGTDQRGHAPRAGGRGRTGPEHDLHLLVDGRKRKCIARHAAEAGPHLVDSLEAANSHARIGREAGFAVFSVVNYVDA